MDYSKKRIGTSLPASLLLFAGLLIVSLSINAGGITTNANWCRSDIIISTPIIAAGVGCLVAMLRHLFTRHPRGEANLVRVIIDDFRFQSFATISILAIVYAIIQGLCFGAASGLLIQAIQASTCWGESLLAPSQSVAMSGISILVLLVTRLAIESYALVYRVANDIALFARDKSPKNRNED